MQWFFRQLPTSPFRLKNPNFHRFQHLLYLTISPLTSHHFPAKCLVLPFTEAQNTQILSLFPTPLPLIAQKTPARMAPYAILLLSLLISSFSILLLSVSLSSIVYVSFTSVGSFHQHININWGEERAQILEKGQLVTMTLDQFSGSGFQSKDEYLYGRVEMQLKLVHGDSAGTVTAFYLSSNEPAHDEIDFEFLGNVSGEPYIVHTNIYTQGHAGREMQFYMWFDPTLDFHTYTIIWNPERVIFLVDDIPIRVYTNHEKLGVPYPSRQPMRLYSSIWNADSWATQGGKVKIDWTKAPFTASCRNLRIDACVWPSTSSCDSPSPKRTWSNQELDAIGKQNLQWVHKNYMVYNYCTDFEKFVHGIPYECRL